MRVGCRIIVGLLLVGLCFGGVAFSQPLEEQPDKIGTMTIDVWEEPNVKYVFSAMPEGDAQFLEHYIINCLEFAHDTYSYISWSMQAARRNLTNPLFEQRMKSLQRYLDQTVTFAQIIARLNPDRENLTKALKHLEEMKQATDLLVEGNSKNEKNQTTPSDKVMRSGEIHERIGKLLASLTVEIGHGGNDAEHKGHED